MTVLAKVRTPTAAELCVPIDLSPEARALMAPEMTPAQFYDALLAAELFADALWVIAFGLPKREAVWWCCVCLRTLLNDDTGEKARAALAAAEKWTYEPTEPHRYAAESAANEEQEHPAHYAAYAAFLSGPSLLPPDFTPVAPAPELTHQTVWAGVYQAVMLGEVPADPGARFRAMLAKGVDIANGGWGTDAPAAR